MQGIMHLFEFVFHTSVTWNYDLIMTTELINNDHNGDKDDNNNTLKITVIIISLPQWHRKLAKTDTAMNKQYYKSLQNRCK